MIEDGNETIEHAGQIVDADGEASSPTISVEAEGDGQADDQGPFPDPPPLFPRGASNPFTSYPVLALSALCARQARLR